MDSHSFDLIILLCSLLFYSANFFFNEYILLIIAIAFITSIFGKLSDYQRQCQKNSILLCFDSSFIVVVILIFHDYKWIEDFIYLCFLILSCLYLYKSRSTEKIKFIFFSRLSLLVSVYTSYIVQILFFFFCEDKISVQFLFVWRIMISAGSGGALLVRFLPKDSLQNKKKFAIFASLSSILGSICAITYLYYDSSIDVWHFAPLLIFMLLLQSLRYSTSRNLMLLYQIGYRFIHTRFFLILLCSIILILFSHNYNFILYATLPCIYLLITITDFLVLRRFNKNCEYTSSY